MRESEICQNERYSSKIQDSSRLLKSMESISGVLWKCKYGIAGNIYWKKKFTYLDSEKLLHWQTEKRPTDTKTPPRHGFLLKRCTITEEPKLRPCAFKIYDREDKRSMIFAADNVAEYEKWLKILMKDHTSTNGSDIAEELIQDENLDFDFDFENDEVTIASESQWNTADDQLRHTNSSNFHQHASSDNSISASIIPSKRAPNAQAQSRLAMSSMTLLDPNAKLESKRTVADIAGKFFERNDFEQNPPYCINQRELESLLTEIDMGLNVAVTAKFIFTSLNILNGFISLDQFLKWWKDFEIDRQATVNYLSSLIIDNVELDSSKYSARSVIASTAHHAGVMDVFQITDSLPSTYSLLMTKLPDCGGIVTNVAAKEFDSWNAAFQDSYDKASARGQLTATHAPIRSNIARSETQNSMISLARTVSQVSVMTDSTEGEHQTRSAAADISAPIETPIVTAPNDSANSDSEELANALQFAAFYGEFLETAQEGSKLIVDEYCLPDSLRTIVRLNLEGKRCISCQHAADCDALDVDCDDSLFVHKGLLFRVVSHSGAEVDQPGRITEARTTFLREFDLIAHKVSSAELRAQRMVQSAVSEIDLAYADIKENLNSKFVSKSFYGNIVSAIKSDNVFGPRTVEMTTSEYRSRIGKSINTKGICKFRSILSTIVDYSGLRIQVMCPLIDLSPTATLVNGFAKEPQTDEDVFVDASTHVQHCLGKLSRYTNISLCYIYCKNVSKEILGEKAGREDEDLLGKQENKCIVSAFNKDVQSHYSPDGKYVYLVNLQSLLPCDLPTDRKDLATRNLRPELVKASVQAVSAMSFRYETRAEREQSEDGSIAAAPSTIEADLAIKQLKINGLCIEKMYTDLIPRVAAQLDSYAALPIDSYSLTQFLHIRGVCCRHIGLIHDFCTSHHSRRLLLAEAIGRAAKSILQELLRAQLRRAKAAAISATLRGRSSEKDFFDHKEATLSKRKRLVLGFYNAMFGSGEESMNFWSSSGPLSAVVMSKFGLSCDHLLACRKENSSELFEIFVTTQYHTGVQLVDSNEYRLFDLREQNPFKASDLACFDGNSESLPTIKSLLQSVVVPGPLGKCFAHPDNLPESLHISGLHAESIKAFRIRLSLLSCLSRGGWSRNPKQWVPYAHNVYMLALALHSSSELGSNREAISLIKEVLSIIPKFCPIACRLISLLSSVQLMEGDYSDAMASFDAGVAMHNTCFGPGHPLTILQLCTLGDAYRSLPMKRGAKQCRVLLSLCATLSQASLGAQHEVSVGYMSKLALVCIEQEDYSTAIELLQKVVPICEGHCRSESVHANSFRDLQQNLYLISLAFTETKAIDRATEYCAKLLNNTTTYLLSSRTTSEPFVLSIFDLSGLILMSDLKVRYKDLEAAKLFLEQANDLIKVHRFERLDVGVTAARLALKMLALQLGSLSRQSRVFAETVALETLQQLQHMQGTIGTADSIERAPLHLSSFPPSAPQQPEEQLEAGDNNKALMEVVEGFLDALWTQQPGDVLANALNEAIHREHEHDVCDIPETDTSSSGTLPAALIRLALSCKLVKRSNVSTVPSKASVA